MSICLEVFDTPAIISKLQIPVVEQAIETVTLMPGTDKSRGYCLEIISADLLAAQTLKTGIPRILVVADDKEHGVVHPSRLLLHP